MTWMSDATDPLPETRRLQELVGAAINDSALTVEQARRLLQHIEVALEELGVAEEELKAQGEQLIASQAVINGERVRYGELFEFAPDCYAVTDELSNITEVNSALAELLGSPARFLVGRLMVSFIAPDARRDVRRLLRVVSETRVEQTTTTLETASGPMTVEIRLGGTVDTTGTKREIRWLIRDITEREKLEHQVAALELGIELLSAATSITRLAKGADPLSGVLDRLVALLVGIAPDVSVGTTVIEPDGRLVVVAASDDVATELDSMQHATSSGPCIDAAMTNTVQRWTIAEDPDRWPELARAAAAHDIVSVVAFPLPVGDEVAGALNLYLRNVDRVDDAVSSAFQLLADHAAGAIANAKLLDEAAQLAHNLSLALESRGDIEQAKGILMAREHCTADEAFDMLRRASQRQNVKLRDVARDIIARNRPS
jgi:PAS domain S-box-containing protein